MGDRGNIALLDREGNQIWFYTHWNGSGVRQAAQHAIARRERWDDPPYFARIVFGELLCGSDPKSATGFGISSSIGDNEHPIVVIDMGNNRVGLIDEKKLVDGRVPKGHKLKWSFEEYCAEKFPEVS